MSKSSWLFVLVAGALANGCLYTKGAVSLTPQVTQDSKSVWIYLDTNKAGATGVYRCVDAGEHPICNKAEVTR